MLAGLSLFCSAAHWQWQRGVAKRADRVALERAEALPPVVLAADAMLAGIDRHRRVEVVAEALPEVAILLDSQVREGVPGVLVYGVLPRRDGMLLVARGFLPWRDRSALPEVPPALPSRWRGRLAALPAPGLKLGDDPPFSGWPWLLTRLDPEALTQALGRPLLPLLLQPEAVEPGFAPVAGAAGLSPERHFGYAVQWSALAVLAVVLFVIVHRPGART